ncbi:MAG: hypothetical protein AVDCRST_MAG65-574 [uncultured Solirubrobacteraceae bacterium]|uniref:Uncharacterized protein n=1 Tax=uncultured Solirubrobacteraceae bacterium TaxID=1162706 RepID=A0A6J4RAQ8_9ACTN|nr:MAG: hypothetical protein AVDCRST_MAG65-574 [uncultured Solirubrobacteraceae bacterium]
MGDLLRQGDRKRAGDHRERQHSKHHVDAAEEARRQQCRHAATEAALTFVDRLVPDLARIAPAHGGGHYPLRERPTNAGCPFARPATRCNVHLVAIVAR